MRFLRALTSSLVFAVLVRAQAIGLGSAAAFGVLGASTVTNTGTTLVGGDIGVSPGTAITGFPPGLFTGTAHVNDGTAIQAQADALIANNVAAALPPTADLSGIDLGGLVLTTGVYFFGTSAQLTGVLTLDAQGDSSALFVFQITSTLTTASDSAVVLINGGQLCNVIWQVGSSATLGTGSAFIGTILADASITANTGASSFGSLIALRGAVTLQQNNVELVGACVAPISTTTTTTSTTSSSTSLSSSSSTTTASTTSSSTSLSTSPSTTTSSTTPASSTTSSTTSVPPTSASPVPNSPGPRPPGTNPPGTIPPGTLPPGPLPQAPDTLASGFTTAIHSITTPTPSGAHQAPDASITLSNTTTRQTQTHTYYEQACSCYKSRLETLTQTITSLSPWPTKSHSIASTMYQAAALPSSTPTVITTRVTSTQTYYEQACACYKSRLETLTTTITTLVPCSTTLAVALSTSRTCSEVVVAPSFLSKTTLSLSSSQEVAGSQKTQSMVSQSQSQSQSRPTTASGNTGTSRTGSTSTSTSTTIPVLFTGSGNRLNVVVGAKFTAVIGGIFAVVCLLCF